MMDAKLREHLRNWKQTGDKNSLSAILKYLEPQIEYAVGQYYNSGLPEAALRAEAKRLAIQALNTYDENKGALKTHVGSYLRKLYRYVNDHQNIARLPENHRLELSQLLNVENELRDRYGREPTLLEISNELGWPTSKIEQLKRETKPITAVGVETWEAYAGNDELEAHNAYVYAASKLSPEEQKVLEFAVGYGGKSKSTGEIATELGKSPAWVSQKKAKIAQLLREYIESAGI